MGERFSKKLLVASLERRIESRAVTYCNLTRKKIDPSNGWAQCGQNPEVHRIYGEWVALVEVLAATKENWL